MTGVVLLVLAVTTFVEVSKLPTGSAVSPQTGFFPLIIGIILGILSLIRLGQAVIGRTEREDSLKIAWTAGSVGWRSLGSTVLCLFLYGLFFEYLGYLVSTFLLIALIVRAVGTKKWGTILAIAFISDSVSYLIFCILLQCQLPAGILGKLGIL